MTNRWVYDGQHRVVAQVSAAGAVTERYVYLSQSNSPDYVLRGTNAFALVKNHLGSVRLVVDGTGTVVQRLDYDAWGNTQLDTAPGFQSFGFAGGVADGATKWVHFGYRDYEPSSALWTGRDPIRFQLNSLSPEPMLQVPTYVKEEALEGFSVPTYAYARNNPLKYTDPTGLFAWIDECEAGGVNVYSDRLDPGRFKFVATSSTVQFSTGNQDACEDLELALGVQAQLQSQGFGSARGCWRKLIKQMAKECDGVRKKPKPYSPSCGPGGSGSGVPPELRPQTNAAQR